MSVKEANIQELSSLQLRDKYKQEFERVTSVLLRYFPLSDSVLDFILRDLQIIHKELKRRNEPLTI